jgi:peptidoglycan hydrolase-like protein with peptidoglycan-binding domain
MVKPKMPLYALILAAMGAGYGAIKIFEHVKKGHAPALPSGASIIPPQHVWGKVEKAVQQKVLNLIHASTDSAQLRQVANGLNNQGAVGAAAAAHAKANALDSKSGAFITALQQHLPAAQISAAMTNAPPPATGPVAASAATHTTSSHPDVKARVVAFQKAHSLSPDGIVGPISWAAMTNTPKVVNMAAVKVAVRNYQMSKGLTPDGIVGNDTLNSLGIA